MENYLKLLRFLRGHRKLFSVAVATMFVASFFEVFQLSLLVPMVDVIFTHKKIVLPNALPHFIENLVNHLNSMDPARLFPLFIGGFVVLLLFKNILMFGYQYFMGDV